MLLNTPIITVLDDQDHQSVIQISATYAATNAGFNVVVIQANTLYGANTSLPCIICVNDVQYTSSIANGSLVIEYVSSGNANSPICTFGRANDGEIVRYFKNQANTPTGDINLFGQNLEANDSFTIIISVLKEYLGCSWASIATMNVGQNYGAGAWANAQAHYNNPGYN
jgi:hypothetical protein